MPRASWLMPRLMSLGKMKPLTTMTASPAQFASILRRKPDLPVGSEPMTSRRGSSSCASSRDEPGVFSGSDLRLITGYSVSIRGVQVPRDRGEGIQVGPRHFSLPGLVEADWQHAFQAHAIPEDVHLAVR